MLCLVCFAICRAVVADTGTEFGDLDKDSVHFLPEMQEQTLTWVMTGPICGLVVSCMPQVAEHRPTEHCGVKSLV